MLGKISFCFNCRISKYSKLQNKFLIKNTIKRIKIQQFLTNLTDNFLLNFLVRVCQVRKRKFRVSNAAISVVRVYEQFHLQTQMLAGQRDDESGVGEFHSFAGEFFKYFCSYILCKYSRVLKVSCVNNFRSV